MKQTMREFECIIVDDASTDGTADIARKFIDENHLATHWKVVSEANSIPKGVSNARNRGMSASIGDFLFFLDADDVLEVECLATLLDAQQRYDADLVACNILKCKPNGHSTPQVSNKHLETQWHFSPDDLRDLINGLPFFDSSCAKLFRRSLLEKAQLQFHEKMPFGEDTLFTCRAAILSRHIVILTKYCGYHYLLHDSSSSARMAPRDRLASLQLLLFSLNQEASVQHKSILLRKSCEYLWTIRKTGGTDTWKLLRETLSSPLWKEILYPVIVVHGKWKHRVCARLLNQRHLWAIKLW